MDAAHQTAGTRLSDSTPAATQGLSRRQLLLGTGASIAGLALASLSAHAQRAMTADPAPSAAAASSEQLDAFYALSRLLTGHANLDLTVGARLYQAMAQHDPAFPTQVAALSQYAHEHGFDTVEPLEQALKGQPLHAALLAIVAAWYSGVVEPGTQATVYAYERALMYQPSRDGMVIPTYAHNGPNYWVAEPPPLDRLPSF